MKNPKYLSYTYYYNIKRKRTRGLSARSIEEQKINNVLINLFEEELKISETFYMWAKLHLKELHDQEIEEDKKLAKIQRRALNTLEDKKARLRELFVDEVITREEFQGDLKKLEQQISSKKTSCEYTENWYEQIEELLDTLFHFGEIIKKGSYSEKRKALELISPNLVWDEQNLLILKENWLKIFLEGRNTLLQEYPMFEPRNNVVFKGLNSVLDIRCPTLLGILLKVRKIACKI